MRQTSAYKSLPYNPNLRQKARELRRAGVLHEALMWNQLKRKGLNGLDFDRQKIIGNYIVDFFCAERAFVLELDGASHCDKEKQDARRDAFLRSLGLTVERISAEEVLKNMDGIVEYLRRHPALTTPSANAATPPEEGSSEASP